MTLPTEIPQPRPDSKPINGQVIPPLATRSYKSKTDENT
jgi:hypothetical protein